MNKQLMEVETPKILPDGTGDGLVSPVRLQRSINAVLGHLGAVGVDVEMEAREDGRVAVVLPLQWASLLLANLTAQAEAFKEKLQRAAWEMRGRQAKLEAASDASRQRWESEQAAVYAAYKKLIARRLPHREALHRLKKNRGETWTITLLEDTMQKQGAKERREKRTELEAGIQRKAKTLTQKEIAEQEGLSVEQVKWALRKGRTQSKPYGSRAALRERRDLILSLREKGIEPKAIAGALGVNAQAVYNTREKTSKGGCHANTENRSASGKS